jgi:hypothetical protein
MSLLLSQFGVCYLEVTEIGFDPPCMQIYVRVIIFT